MQDFSRSLIDFSKSQSEEPVEAVCVSVGYLDASQLALHSEFIEGESISLDSIGVHCGNFQRLAVANLSDSSSFDQGKLRARALQANGSGELVELADDYWEQTRKTTFPMVDTLDCYQMESLATVKDSGR